jgi:hypothetical protein
MMLILGVFVGIILMFLMIILTVHCEYEIKNNADSRDSFMVKVYKFLEINN